MGLNIKTSQDFLSGIMANYVKFDQPNSAERIRQ